MDAMLQRHCARYIYVIPDGLRELMSDISREVLRSQPQDIYTFIADYLDALIITRENARIAARLVQSLTETALTIATLLEATGMNRDEIDILVAATQETFKKTMDLEPETEAEIDEQGIISNIVRHISMTSDQAEAAASIIQNAYRRFKARKQREQELLEGMIDWRSAARSAIRLYRKCGVSNEEANRAATLIKAAYKGYYTRKLMKKIVDVERSNNIISYLEEHNDEYYGELEEETEHEYDADKDNDNVSKSVKIDYSTIKPHVDFDTDAPELLYPNESISSKVSSPSSIAGHTLRYIFDAALKNIGTIIEDDEDNITADSDADNKEIEIKKDDTDTNANADVPQDDDLKHVPSGTADEMTNITDVENQ